MVRSALAAFLRLARGLLTIAARRSNRRPTRLSTTDARLLRDIGLGPHDLWDGAPEVPLRLVVGVAAPFGTVGAAPGTAARTREARTALARLWAEETGRA